MDAANKEIIISSVIFGDNIIEVSYFEKRDQAERAGLTKSLVIERGIAPLQIAETLELLEEIVDKGLLEIRNPESSLDPRKRLGQTAGVTPTE